MERLWIALVEVRAQPHLEWPVEDGRGAYCNAVVPARTLEECRARLVERFAAQGYDVIAIEDPEPLDWRGMDHGDLDPLVAAAAQDAGEHGLSWAGMHRFPDEPSANLRPE